MDSAVYRELRPMSIGDIFDEAFDLYKHNFALFAGIVAIVGIPSVIAIDCATYAMGFDRLGSGSRPPTGDQVALLLGMMALYMGVLMLYSVLYVVQSGALTIAVSSRYLGAGCTVGQAYRRIRPAILRLVITWVVTGVIVCAGAIAVFAGLAIFLGLIAAGASAGSGSPGDVFAAIIGIMVTVIPGVVMFASAVWVALFTTQIVVLEGDGFVTAMGRNIQLVKGAFLRMCGAAILIFVIAMGLVITIELSVQGALGLFVYPWAHVPQLWRHVIESIWGGIVSLLAQPFTMVCLTLLYYDRRVRKEAFDLALLERNLQPAPAPASIEAPT